MKSNNLFSKDKERQRKTAKISHKTIGVIFIITAFLTIFLITNASAVPPVTTVANFNNGYIIVESQQEYIKINQDYKYNFFVYNYSNGLVLDNSTLLCKFFLANSSGDVIYNTNATYYLNGYWGVNIGAGNFSATGIYPYGVSCQDGSGGALSGDWEVTSTGKYGFMFYFILLTSLASIFLMASLIVDEEFFVYISGILWMIGGIYLMINGIDVMNDSNTRNLSYIYLGIGMLFTVGAYIYNSYNKYSEDDD